MCPCEQICAYARTDMHVHTKNLLRGQFIFSGFIHEFYSASKSRTLQGPAFESKSTSASIHVTTLMCTNGTPSKDGEGHLEYHGSLWGSWPTLSIHQHHANTMLSNQPNTMKHFYGSFQELVA
jgi:hypothetical protein